MKDTFFNEVFEGRREAAPLLNQIRSHPQREGMEASYEQEDGKIVDVEYQKASVQYSLKFDEGRGLSPLDFLERAREIGREIGTQMEMHLLQSVSKMTDEVGNVVAANSAEIKFEQWLELNEKMLTDFDEDGEPSHKTLVCSPEFQAKLEVSLKEWDADPEKVAACRAVMAKQKEAYHAREACRRLVD